MNENLQENWTQQLLKWIQQLPYVDKKPLLYKIVFKYAKHVDDYTVRKLLQHASKSEEFSPVEAELLQSLNDYFSTFSHEELLIIDTLMYFKDSYKMYFKRDPSVLRIVFASLVVDLGDIGKPLLEVVSLPEKTEPKRSNNNGNKSKKIKAIILMMMVISSSIIGILFTILPLQLHLSLDSDLQLADVNEDIKFEFRINGNYQKGILIFGDGSMLELDGSQVSITHKYTLQGKYHPTIIAFNNLGSMFSESINIEITNHAPKFELNVPVTAKEDEKVQIEVNNLSDSNYDLQNSVITYLYDFADGNQTITNSSTISHSWQNIGTYPISVSLIDDQNAITTRFADIKIFNGFPESSFDFTVDGNRVECSAINVIDTKSDLNSLTYIWDFGDNCTGFGKKVVHCYSNPDFYDVELMVLDDNGANGTISKTIEIKEVKYLPKNEAENIENLEILGPLCFPNGVEGQALKINVENYAPFDKIPDLRYSWKNNLGEKISSELAPSFVFDDGMHELSLNISDNSGVSIEKDVKVNVENISPEVFITDYCYFGPSSQRSDYGSHLGELNLVAHARDSIHDVRQLHFQWSITNGKETFTYGGSSPHPVSIFRFKCTESVIYRAKVDVIDPSGRIGSCEFKIYSTIDQNKNGIGDSFDAMLDITGENLLSFLDSDGDGISNLYETSILHSNPENPDSDGDGVVDGVGANGVGELSLGTNVIQSDSDFDGLKDFREHEGWGIQITTLENTLNLHVSSDPVIYDTDMDGLSDYEEFLNGTNPRVSDSDKDGLIDRIDPYPIHWDNDNDGLSDKEELTIGTGLNNSDTDNDGISDGSEIKGWGPIGFQTNPLDPDMDRDFAADGSEVKAYSVKLESDNSQEVRVNVSNPAILFFPYLFQEANSAQIAIGLSFGEHGSDHEQEYGIEQSKIGCLQISIRHRESGIILFQETTHENRYFSKTIDLANVFNNKTLAQNYFGHYILEVNDTSAGCLVERFEIDAYRYLDPHNADFDDDGILDGVEMDLLINGKKDIDVNDFYKASDLRFNSTNNVDYKPTEFSLEIPLIGRIDDAKFRIRIESIFNPKEEGNMTIAIVKKPLSNRLEEQYVYHSFRNFYANDNFYHHDEFFLSDIHVMNKPKSKLGTFVLRIQAFTDGSEITPFILKDFSIELDTFIQAGPLDNTAWLTDPSLSDTDHDGWDDWHEIFESGTNPTCADTDLDGAIDSEDWDPLRNVVLQIIPLNAAYRNQLLPTLNPYLQIGISLQINDLEDPEALKEESSIGFFTPSKQTTFELNAVGSYQVAYWNNYQYHLDINDNKIIQSSNIPFQLTLWEDIPTGDLNRFDNKWYSTSLQFNSIGDQTDIRVTHVGGLGFTDEINIRVKILGIERCNTIAIFHENETSFNGHYQEPERVNIFQLHVIDSGEGTPFVQGANSIVIPTSIFSKTVLNGFIENNRVNETILYSGVEGEFEFYSIDRDGAIQDDGCGEVDFVFFRHGLTAQEAKKILEMLLNCSVSQGLDENNNTITTIKLVHDYTSTKLQGITAVALNLPKSASRFVLWNPEIEDSPYGTTPEPFNPFFVFLYLYILIFPPAKLPILFTVTMVAIIRLNDQSAVHIGLMFTTMFANLVWCAIRTALLVISYLMLAVEVLTTSIIIAGIGTMLSLTDLSSDWELSWNIPYGVDTTFGYVEFEIFDQVTRFEASINWTYWEYFDLYFPWLNFDTALGTMLEDYVEDGEEVSFPPELACGFDHVKDLKYDFHTIYRQLPQGYAPNYVNLTLVDPQGESYHYIMEVTYPRDDLDYTSWVRFNKTIDFENFAIQDRQGQWHYYFTTIASVSNCTTRWPSDGVAVGPFFDEWRPYFISSHLDPFSGRINELFTFETTGCDNVQDSLPETVWLKILWPNNSLQMFPLDLLETYHLSNSTYAVHRISINFSKYLDIDSPVTLKHYFEARFADGKRDVLWDLLVLGEPTENENELVEYELEWFEGPTLLPIIEGENAPPIIRKWYLEDCTWNRLIQEECNEKVLSPISDEFVLRFWLYIEDPDGSHLEHWNNGFIFEPKLILTNLDTPNKSIKPIPMKFTGGTHGPGPAGYDEYFVDVWGDGYFAYNYDQIQDLKKCNFTSGAWKFEFSVTDNQSHHVRLNPERKLWHIGSFEHMINTLFYGHPTEAGTGGLLGSVITTIGYIAMTILSAFKDPKFQVAAQVVAAGIAVTDIIFNFMSFTSFVFAKKDMGALLGLGFNLLLKSIGLLISLSISDNIKGNFNFNFINSFSGILLMFSFFDLFAETSHFETQEDENGNEYIALDQDSLTWDEMLGGYPMMIVSFLSSIVGLTASLAITSGAARFGVGTEHIKKIMLIHIIISISMSALCFTSFFINSGFIHVGYDLLISGSMASYWKGINDVPIY